MYNKINYYKRIIAIQEDYLTHKNKDPDMTNKEIYYQVIQPKYFISKRSFDEYLGIPAKRELKKIVDTLNTVQ